MNWDKTLLQHSVWHAKIGFNTELCRFNDLIPRGLIVQIPTTTTVEAPLAVDQTHPHTVGATNIEHIFR